MTADETGLVVSLTTLERATAPLLWDRLPGRERRCDLRSAPGERLQIDSGERWAQGGDAVAGATCRNGHQAAVAVEYRLLNTLKIENVNAADWGGMAGIIAALWPERYRALISANGSLTGQT
jgi:hypothetical protein